LGKNRPHRVSHTHTPAHTPAKYRQKEQSSKSQLLCGEATPVNDTWGVPVQHLHHQLSQRASTHPTPTTTSCPSDWQWPSPSANSHSNDTTGKAPLRIPLSKQCFQGKEASVPCVVGRAPQIDDQPITTAVKKTTGSTGVSPGVPSHQSGAFRGWEEGGFSSLCCRAPP